MHEFICQRLGIYYPKRTQGPRRLVYARWRKVVQGEVARSPAVLLDF